MYGKWALLLSNILFAMFPFHVLFIVILFQGIVTVIGSLIEFCVKDLYALQTL